MGSEMCIRDRVMNADLFRSAWGNFATGVSLVTTTEEDGSVHGMTANGIASISLDPMLSMVSVGHSANSYSIIKNTGRFGINILTEQQRSIGEFYAKSDNAAENAPEASFKLTENGTPFLEGSLSSIDCRVVSTYVEGDHTLFIGAVEAIELGNGEPLLFFQGKWKTF